MATARKFREATKKGLHIEAEGCIVNIYEGLRENKTDREVTVVEILPDDGCSGEPIWRLRGCVNNRIIKLKKKNP